MQAGYPLLISGRFSMFGIGLPALIRVSVEGPAYDPSVRHFDTFSSPSGDYSVNVAAEKYGEYEVYAQAYLPSISLPFLPDLILGPSLAESPKPPVVVGEPEAEGLVKTITAEGLLQSIPAPPPVYVDVSVPVAVEVRAPATSAAPVVLLPTPPPDIPVSELPPLAKQAVAGSATFTPLSLYSGDSLRAEIVWGNSGGEGTRYDVVIYLIDESQMAYGPFPAALGTWVPAEGLTSGIVNIDTAGLPDGIYTARVDIKDADTGTMLTSRTFYGPQLLETPIADINVSFPTLEGDPGDTLSATITWEPV